VSGVEPIQIRLSGSGGQGLILGALVLAESLIGEGRKVAQSQAFEPVSRGGVSRSDLVVGSAAPDYPLATELDLLLLLDQCAVAVSMGMIRPGALVLADAEHVPRPPAGDFRLHALPFVGTARRLGNPRVANMAALGAMARLGGLCRLETLLETVSGAVPPAYVEVSQEALRAGHVLAQALGETGRAWDAPKVPDPASRRPASGAGKR
jgi:2-oxoglutarate ferredoxin oxidoreductase subunit gamma